MTKLKMMGKKVRFTKLREAQGAKYPTATGEGDYEPGRDNGPLTPPNGYEVLGTLGTDVQVGASILIERTHRNGVEVSGVLVTSQVTGLEQLPSTLGKYRITTVNSVYLLEIL